MTPIADILAAATPTTTGFTTAIPVDWMQGRTSYGGLSSALALHAAQHCEPGLPPLRTALIAFVGPLAGDVTVTATRLRRGRTAAFIQADISSESGLGYRATFVFMHDLPSKIDFDQRPLCDQAPPGADARLHTGPDEFFTGNFNFLDVKDPDLAPAELLRWARLRARDGLDPMVELLAIADGLPPAAHKLLGNVHVPLSTITWQINLLNAHPATTDGWWLLSARTDYARNGSTSQAMTVRNASGELLADAIQSVAIFA